jgi:cyclohexa-1,5-dienecarbonyl-CoA hydratase
VQTRADDTTVSVVDEAGGRWRRLVIDAPPGNLLSLAMVRALDAAIAAAASHGPGLRWLTIEGAGHQFSYGASIPEHLPEPMREVLPATHRMLRRLLAFPAPTAALVEGRCLGGGFELALCCDDILAEASAHFGLPEVGLAAFPPVAAALLPIRIGAARASRAVLTGGVETATAWQDTGLLAMTTAGDVRVAARGWYDRHLAVRSPVALCHAVLAARAVWLPAAERAIVENERRYLDGLLASPDAAEGVRAWMEKRPPVWRER